MQALKTKGVAHNGVLSVNVPKEFDEKEFEVTILATGEKNMELRKDSDDSICVDEVKKFHELSPSERLKILEQYKGTAQFPDVAIDKYDVYDQ